MILLLQITSLYAKPPLSSGLPVPRFAALRSSDVNIRTGPGTRYPIAWVIKKKFLPVKVISEHENWRKIELHDGTFGWAFQSMLTGNKTAMVNTPKAFLRRAPQENSAIIASIGEGIIGQLKLCKDNWCKIAVKDYVGWMERNNLWGVEFDKK